MSKTKMKDMVVLLPGIMGSVLEKDGKPVWDTHIQALLTAVKSWRDGSPLEHLKLAGDDLKGGDIGDGIIATRLMPKVVVPIPKLPKSGPDEILVSKSQGTCLDLAVLFCGICLRYELIPLLIVSGNHAWVAVSLTHWLHECKASDREGKKLFKDGLLTDKDKVAELCNLVEDEEAYIAIECTGFTQGSFSKSFDEAEREGLKRLRNFSSRNGGFILDVPIAHNFYWRDLCHKRLEAEPIKRLINSPLTNGENPLLKLYVPLGLIERKPDAQRRPRENDFSPEGSSFNKPDAQYEVVREYEHKKFFEEVLEQKSSSRSQGKRLAIVGDPGGGKTTLLQRIAYWVLKEEQGLPIWVPLGDVNENWLKGRDGTDEGWLYRYLSENWLRNVAGEPEKTPRELQQTFAELLKSGQVWLLLDGADEMALRHPLTRVKEQLAKDWADSVRVVLNCRLNLWEVEKEALWEKFDIYRTLDFSYPDQVHQFINKWFGEDDPKAKELQDKLAEENRKRLQNLVKNPLRLALLCRIWKRGLATLPETKADFYRLLVKEHYKWKDDSTNKVFTISGNQKKELNRALSQLARDAIDSENFRFRLRESFIINHDLGEPDDEDSLFWWPLKLGWLIDVGFPSEGERNQGEKVYAFFHPTFQEYFAATVDNNYGFFLPREHRDRPVKDKNNPEKYERYRIFERQWKEVILLWLGRPEEEVSDKQKEDFIRALVAFEDGCECFYGYRAYFLAAVLIAELRNYNSNLPNQIVEQIVNWISGCFPNQSNLNFYTPTPIQAGARLIIQQSNHQLVIDTLIPRLNNSDYQGQVRHEIMEILGEIGTGSYTAIKALEQILENKENENKCCLVTAACSLIKISRGKDREKAIKILLEFLQDFQLDVIDAIQILDKLDWSNIDDAILVDTIAYLTNRLKQKSLDDLISFNSLYIAKALIKIAPKNHPSYEFAINRLIHLQKPESNFDSVSPKIAAQFLKDAGYDNSEEVKTSYQDHRDTFRDDLISRLERLGLTLDSEIINTIKALIDLMCSDEKRCRREQAAWCLEVIILDKQFRPQRDSFASVVNSLKICLTNLSQRNDHCFGIISVGVQDPLTSCNKLLWYFAQTLPYPEFYQA